MHSHSRVKTQKNKRPSAIDPCRSASQTGWVSLLWITPLFAGRLTPPRTKSLIHGKKGTVSAGPLLLPLLRPHSASLCRLAGLLSPMFSPGSGSSASTAKHPEQTRLEFWGPLTVPPFGPATKPSQGRVAKACQEPKHEDVGSVPRSWPESIQEDG